MAILDLNDIRFSPSTFAERTFRKAPQKAPSAVTVYGIDPSTVRVVWRYVAPSLEEEPVIGYKVKNFAHFKIYTCSCMVRAVSTIVLMQIFRLSEGLCK